MGFRLNVSIPEPKYGFYELWDFLVEENWTELFKSRDWSSGALVQEGDLFIFRSNDSNEKFELRAKYQSNKVTLVVCPLEGHYSGAPFHNWDVPVIYDDDISITGNISSAARVIHFNIDSKKIIIWVNEVLDNHLTYIGRAVSAYVTGDPRPFVMMHYGPDISHDTLTDSTKVALRRMSVYDSDIEVEGALLRQSFYDTDDIVPINSANPLSGDYEEIDALIYFNSVVGKEEIVGKLDGIRFSTIIGFKGTFAGRTRLHIAGGVTIPWDGSVP